MKLWLRYLIFLVASVFAAATWGWVLSSINNQETLQEASQEGFPGPGGFIIGGIVCGTFATLPAIWAFGRLKETMIGSE